MNRYKSNICAFSAWKWMAGTVLLLLLTANFATAQDELNVIRGESSGNSWIHFSDAENSLYHHLAGEAYELLEERSATVASLETEAEWRRYRDGIRRSLMETIGPFPEKTPLNAKITGTIQKEGYRIEHILFESQPEFYVTSSLFIPDDIREPAPAVLYLSGHTQEGYRSETYQHKIINLVRKGFVVFAFDPVSQGERLQYFHPETGESLVGGPTREHSYAGIQAFIAGHSLARIMVWDGIRAVDYLLTREEVDPERLGMTGRSGGGTQTAYIAAIDDRIHAAAPEAYITTFTRLFQSIGPQDAEQNLFRGIARGIDHPDLLIARAPKPTLLIATTEDFFSIQGAREAAAEVSGLYRALGVPDYFEMAEDTGVHQSTPQNREAMYAFFQHHLNNPGTPVDEEVEIPSEEELRVTETGQVASSEGGITVSRLNREQAEKKSVRLREAREHLSEHIHDAVDAAKELSGYREPGATAQPVFTGRVERSGYRIERYFVRGGGDYVVPYLLAVPERPNGKGLIYLHPSGKAEAASEEGEMEWFAKQGFTVIAPDLIGTGETGGGDVANYPTRVNDFEPVSFDEWTAAVTVGRSLAGIQAGDLVRLARILRHEHGTGEVYGVALQETAPVLLHAAAFGKSFGRIALLDACLSFHSIASTTIYDPGFHRSAVAGAGGVYDLADLAAALSPARLLISGAVDAAGRPIDNPEQDQELLYIRKRYEAAGAEEQLRIRRPGTRRPDLQEWIEE